MTTQHIRANWGSNPNSQQCSITLLKTSRSGVSVNVCEGGRGKQVELYVQDSVIGTSFQQWALDKELNALYHWVCFQTVRMSTNKKIIGSDVCCHHSRSDGASVVVGNGRQVTHVCLRLPKAGRAQGRGWGTWAHCRWVSGLKYGGCSNCLSSVSSHPLWGHGPLWELMKAEPSVCARQHAFMISGHHEPRVRTPAFKNPQNYEQWKFLNKRSDSSCYLLLKAI